LQEKVFANEKGTQGQFGEVVVAAASTAFCRPVATTINPSKINNLSSCFSHSVF
jgi:hypothetical protein